MSVLGVVCMMLGVAFIITLLLIEKCEKPTPLGVGWIA